MATAYATLQEFYLYGIHADSVDDTVAATTAILSASRFIDSYLGRRYSVPLEQWPESLSEACAKIAGWRYLVHRGTTVEGADEIKKLAHDEAVSWVKDVANRKAALEGVEGETAPNPGAASVPDVDSEELRGW